MHAVMGVLEEGNGRAAKKLRECNVARKDLLFDQASGGSSVG